MAATFINTEIGRAFRIVSTERSRDLALTYSPDCLNLGAAQLDAYRRMPLDELFDVYEVRVDIPETDYPGPTRAKAVCEVCGAVVRDGRETVRDGKSVCRYCAGDTYYKYPLKVSLADRGM
jgi:formylmethanofuran dehydrogenase subunit E